MRCSPDSTARAREAEGWRELTPCGGGADAPRLLLLSGLRSPELSNDRDLMVALPASYAATDVRYPVVYMQDGQNLFDPLTSFAGHWDLLRVLADLGRRGVEPIVVGIPNHGPSRRNEYSPFRDPAHGGGEGDAYLRFVIDTVKPLMDRSFRTLPHRDSTVIAGSSLGGLISLYALLRRPDVFGAAGALSPSAWFAGEALLGYLGRVEAPGGRVYLDAGIAEAPRLLFAVRRLRNRLARHSGVRLRYHEDPDGTHHEIHWGRRFETTLPFLLGDGNRGVTRRQAPDPFTVPPPHRPPAPV